MLNRGLVTGVSGSRTLQFGYDVENRLTQIQPAGATNPEETIAYDAGGALARRTFGVASAGNARFYVGAGLTVVRSGGIDAASAHVLVGGAVVATVSSAAVVYYHRDRLGSVVATTLEGGIPGANLRYDSYGNATEQNAVPAAEPEYGYTGGLRLSEGLVHLNARVYDPRLRRFLQADNIDGRRYTYAGGDPLNSVDPSGHSPVWIDRQHDEQKTYPTLQVNCTAPTVQEALSANVRETPLSWKFSVEGRRRQATWKRW